jgi:hypothetical protein
MGGTMHRFAGLFSRVYCGFDDENLYIRFDIDEEEIAGYEYRIKFFKPSDVEIIIGESKDVNHKIDKIGEIAIPLTMLKVDDESMIEFMIDAKQKGIEVDRTPALQFNVKLRDVRLYNWTV